MFRTLTYLGCNFVFEYSSEDNNAAFCALPCMCVCVFVCVCLCVCLCVCVCERQNEKLNWSNCWKRFQTFFFFCSIVVSKWLQFLSNHLFSLIRRWSYWTLLHLPISTRRKFRLQIRLGWRIRRVPRPGLQRDEPGGLLDEPGALLGHRPDELAKYFSGCNAT